MYLMQAASSVDGDIYTWTSADKDYDGTGYPGDGTATDVVVAAVAPSLGGSNNPLTDDSYSWEPGSYANTKQVADLKTYDTANGSATVAWSETIPDECARSYVVTAQARTSAGEYYSVDLRAAYERTDGTTTEKVANTASNEADPDALGFSAVISNSTNTIQVTVTGQARWTILVNRLHTALDATPPAVFDPATLSLTGWWRASYASSPWTPTASAGTSGANGNLSEATNPPAAGAAVNGLTPADFDGTNDELSSTAIESTLFTAAAGGVAILYEVDTTTAAGGAGVGILNEEAMLIGVGGYLHMSMNSTGPRCGLYDTGYKDVQLTGGTSGKHFVMLRWNGTNIEASLDGGAWSATACGNMGNLTSVLKLGRNVGGTAFFDGKILEVMTIAAAWADGDRADLVDYVNDRYGLAL